MLQVETGSAITWKYPSVILKGNNTVGEFYSVALTNNAQQADTGTKMVHIGKNTRSKIISKGISAGKSRNAYRGLVQVQPGAEGARNFSQCDSMLIGDNAGANTYPYIQVRLLLRLLIRAAAAQAARRPRFPLPCCLNRRHALRPQRWQWCTGSAAVGQCRTRGVNKQNLGRPALLLPATRCRPRGGSWRHHFGLLPAGLQ